MAKRKRVHWTRLATDRRVIVSEEQVDGTPDFMIWREGVREYVLKMRSSAKPYWFVSASAAREYAENI